MAGVPFAHAFREDIIPFSGGWIACSESAKRSIAGLTRGGRPFWVGIASRGESGVRNRWNQKYKALGMKSIAIIYTTSSDKFRKAMEAELCEFFEGHTDNLVRGGGGPRGTSPYAVYVAWA